VEAEVLVEELAVLELVGMVEIPLLEAILQTGVRVSLSLTVLVLLVEVSLLVREQDMEFLEATQVMEV
jgi:hypothetical protein